MFQIWQRHLFSVTVYSLTSQLQVHNNYNTNTTNTNENITQIQWKTFLVTHVPDMAAAPFLRDRLFWHFSSYNVIHFKHIINTIKIQHKYNKKIGDTCSRYGCTFSPWLCCLTFQNKYIINTIQIQHKYHIFLVTHVPDTAASFQPTGWLCCLTFHLLNNISLQIQIQQKYSTITMIKTQYQLFFLIFSNEQVQMHRRRYNDSTEIGHTQFEEICL